MQIRDRIKELRRVRAAELRPNPRNWRLHPPEQQDAAVAALRFKTEMLWAQLDAIESGDTQPPGPVA